MNNRSWKNIIIKYIVYLNIKCRSQRVSESKGFLLVNGEPMNKKFRSLSAFVQQGILNFY
jgi:hypothetical protein